MTSPNLNDIERAICCPSGVCCSPADCYLADRSRSNLVQIPQAALAVVALLQNGWRAYPVNAGPMVVTRAVERRSDSY